MWNFLFNQQISITEIIHVRNGLNFHCLKLSLLPLQLLVIYFVFKILPKSLFIIQKQNSPKEFFFSLIFMNVRKVVNTVRICHDYQTSFDNLLLEEIYELHWMSMMMTKMLMMLVMGSNFSTGDRWISGQGWYQHVKIHCQFFFRMMKRIGRKKRKSIFSSLNNIHRIIIIPDIVYPSHSPSSPSLRLM